MAVMIYGVCAVGFLLAALITHDAIYATLAERYARQNCTDLQVFTILDRDALANRLAARRLPVNRGKLLIETERPTWQWSHYGGMLANDEYKAYWRDRPLLIVRDIAVAPQNILTRTGIVQRYISYQRSPATYVN